MMKRASRRILAPAFAIVLVVAACSGGDNKPAASSASSASSTGASSTAPKADPGAVSAGDPQLAGYTATGPLIADNGFRPQNNGFSFENYGKSLEGQPDRANLGPDQMRKLFGDAVCADASSGKCDLIPPAQQWMDQQNMGTDGGHCQGFSVLSGLLWKKTENASTFGADATPQLAIDNNEPLQREIAYAFMFQTLNAYNAAIVHGTPNDIVDKLMQVLTPDNPDSYTLGIYKPGFQGGHAVTPFAIEDAGNGVVNILIYDNNFPGVTRAIKVDRNANTWSYDAATNPQNPAELYQGDATTQTLDVEPTSPGVGAQPCPFCGNVPNGGAAAAKGAAGQSGDGGATPSDNLDLIYLDGSDVDHAHLLITDDAGHRLGFVDGKFVSEIPGGSAIFSKASQDFVESVEPDYYVPDGAKYTITVDGTALQEADDTEVGAIGPSFDFAVSHLEIQPGEKSTISMTPYVENLTFSSTRDETPDVEIGISDDVDHNFDISGVTVPAGASVDLALPVDGGQLTLNNAPAGSYNLLVDRFDEQGELNFKHSGVSLQGGDTAVLAYGSWSAKDQPMTLAVTSNGATTNQSLENQA